MIDQIKLGFDLRRFEFRVALVFFERVCCDLALGFGLLQEVGAARLFELENDDLW